MKKKILILNGPNLNRTGKRSPEIYGDEGFDTFVPALQRQFRAAFISYMQSNSEGELIDVLQKAIADDDMCGVVLNPGAYAHYSLALADAVADAMECGLPVVEVHLSNIAGREEFRQKTLTGARAKGVIAGLGLDGYTLAVSYLSTLVDGPGAD